MTAHLAQVFRDAAQSVAAEAKQMPGGAALPANTTHHSTTESLAESPTQVGSGGAASALPNQQPGISLQELLTLHGDSSTPVVLLLLAIFTTLPISGVGTVLSFAIFALAWRWGRHLETTTVHHRIGAIRLSATWTKRCLDFLAWLYALADKLLSPRWLVLTEPNTRPWWAVWICIMGVIIFLPIPLGNLLPSLSLVVFGLGWMFRDGAAMVVSLVLGVAAIAFTAVFGQLAVEAVTRAFQWLVSL